MHDANRHEAGNQQRRETWVNRLDRRRYAHIAVVLLVSDDCAKGFCSKVNRSGAEFKETYIWPTSRNDMSRSARFPMCARDHTHAISSQKGTAKSRLKNILAHFCGVRIASRH